ncbi:hypothetical protein HPB49_018201 [Dermacentor silvarum]|uniref:Uncharacterized protein n=1 Tax=Dermacentor silvarum TaxID=543639 RepID=A0ACB8CGP4_DERSI|nr:hypothetical protein HPB49_018201 [Dermacentor silvarum]
MKRPPTVEKLVSVGTSCPYGSVGAEIIEFEKNFSTKISKKQEPIKIIIRPKKGLQVKSFTNHQISKAVSAACGGKVDDSHFLVRLRPGANIIIVSTPDQEVADIARKITRIVLGGNLYEVNSYVAAPDGVARGVIHGIDPDTPPEELMTHQRGRTQGVEIVQARMLGKTKTAVITFSSHAAAGQSSVVTLESIYATMQQMLYQIGELKNKVKENTLSSEDLEIRIRKVEFASRKRVDDENNNTRIKAYRRINNTGDVSDTDNCDGGGMNVSNG